MKKMKLQVDSLAVDSFSTGDGADRVPGTVHGRGDDGCTWVDTCLCETAYYHCGTGPATIYSCDYTETRRCFGPDTSFEQCATPPITPAC
jgi:hypothetical protein